MSPLPRALAHVNRRVTNRVLGPVAAHLPWFALLTHVGRRSGRSYTVPVSIFPSGARYSVALTYGRESDWVRNVLAAGGCTVQTRGRRVRLVSPRLVHDPAASWAPAPVRIILRLIDAPDVLILVAAPPATS